MTIDLRHQHRWVFCVAALAVWVALGWPVVDDFQSGATIRGAPVSPLWFIPFAIFGTSVLAAMGFKLHPRLRWVVVGVQLAAVVAMAIMLPWAAMSMFLIIIAWEVALATTPAQALGWVGFQTLAIVGALTQALNPDLCWVIGKSFALQLFVVFAAHAVRKEAEASRSLAEANRKLRSAQAIIANTVRNAERLRISRELHDAWGHELTALGLQLEIASHTTEPGRANEHVLKAKGLAGALLGKVRDVVSTLREAERGDLKEALESLANSVPRPVIHVDIAPGVHVGPEQAHALVRCAQEAVTNAMKHADASNLWLDLTPDGEGVRLIARDDGNTQPAAATRGSGLLGMRERIEQLGGRVAVRNGSDFGFAIEAWLPSGTPQPA